MKLRKKDTPMSVDIGPDGENPQEDRSGFSARDEMLNALSPAEVQSPDQRKFERLAVKSDKARIGVNPEQGAHVTSWQLKNDAGEFEDVLYVGSELKRTGIPLLFPYYGDAEGDMRSHGFGRDSKWQGSVDGNRILMTLTSEQISDEARQEYPHDFSALVSIEAEEDGSMVYTLNVVNTGNTKLPLSPGLHPYWAVAQGAKTRSSIEGVQGFDASQTDWEHEPPDTPFEYSGRTTLKTPDKEISIDDITEGGPVIKNIVVWSQPVEKPDHEFICVEPVCGLDNAINDDPIWVEPDQSFTMKLRFSARLNQPE